MTIANLPAIRACRPAWNKGRDLVLFNLAIDSRLRGCDLVKLKVADIYSSGQVKERASIIQSKTQRSVRFEITEGARNSVLR